MSSLRTPVLLAMALAFASCAAPGPYQDTIEFGSEKASSIPLASEVAPPEGTALSFFVPPTPVGISIDPEVKSKVIATADADSSAVQVREASWRESLDLPLKTELETALNGVPRVACRAEEDRADFTVVAKVHLGGLSHFDATEAGGLQAQLFGMLGNSITKGLEIHVSAVLHAQDSAGDLIASGRCSLTRKVNLDHADNQAGWVNLAEMTGLQEIGTAKSAFSSQEKRDFSSAQLTKAAQRCIEGAARDLIRQSPKPAKPQP